jgi:hypothetical protein
MKNKFNHRDMLDEKYKSDGKYVIKITIQDKEGVFAHDMVMVGVERPPQEVPKIIEPERPVVKDSGMRPSASGTLEHGKQELPKAEKPVLTIDEKKPYAEISLKGRDMGHILASVKMISRLNALHTTTADKVQSITDAISRAHVHTDIKTTIRQLKKDGKLNPSMNSYELSSMIFAKLGHTPVIELVQRYSTEMMMNVDSRKLDLENDIHRLESEVKQFPDQESVNLIDTAVNALKDEVAKLGRTHTKFVATQMDITRIEHGKSQEVEEFVINLQEVMQKDHEWRNGTLGDDDIGLTTFIEKLDKYEPVIRAMDRVLDDFWKAADEMIKEIDETTGILQGIESQWKQHIKELIRMEQQQ